MERTASFTPKTTSSVHDIASEEPPFGSRFLTDETQVWSQNAWDHVPPPDDQEETIAASLQRQRLAPVPETEKQKYNDKPSRHWDSFYKANSSNFFRNRKWLHNEFSELVAATRPQAGPKSITEIGCGAGNSVFPLLSVNENPDLTIHAYDYSPHAVKLVQHNPLYLSPTTGSVRASVWDVTSSDGLPPDVEPGSVDIVILVFVMSALHPDEWGQGISNIYKMLKPGGLVVLRDYGRHDLTQLRFKSGRLLDENFYIRGDKTRVYFFELDELALLFTGSQALPSQKSSCTTEVLDDDNTHDGGTPSLPALDGKPLDIRPFMDIPSDNPAPPISITTPRTDNNPNTGIHPNLLAPRPLFNCPSHPLFTIEQLGIDRRLLVNRKRQLKMYRVWMQGKFRKTS